MIGGEYKIEAWQVKFVAVSKVAIAIFNLMASTKLLITLPCTKLKNVGRLPLTPDWNACAHLS